MVRIRSFNFETDYDTIKEWWNKHGSFAPRKEQLPKHGLVVVDGRKPICAGFLYNTDSSICVFEFVISDPEAEKKLRDKSLRKLIDSIKSLSKKLDYNLIYTSINIEAYIRKLKDSGFIEVDKNQTHMFCELV